MSKSSREGKLASVFAALFISIFLVTAFTGFSAPYSVVGYRTKISSYTYDSMTVSPHIDKYGVHSLYQVAASAVRDRNPSNQNFSNCSLAQDVSGIGTSLWYNLTSISQPDGSGAYIASPNTVSHWLELIGFGFTIPSNATINGIVAFFYRKGAATGHENDYSLKIVQGGNIAGTEHASSAYWSTTWTSVTYGNSSDLWGLSWTPLQINEGDFGVAISAKNTVSSGASCFVDFVAIEVYYSTGNTTVNYQNQFSVVPFLGIGVFFTLLLVTVVAVRRRGRLEGIERSAKGWERESSIPWNGEDFPETRIRPSIGFRGKCRICGAAIRAPNSLYCWNCGVLLESASGEASARREKAGRGYPFGKCMVCNLRVNSGDVTMTCPYCGNVAHRTHLLEWLHVKDYCPICHRHLNEESLKRR